jgi:large subunit ribosomal protein L25
MADVVLTADLRSELGSAPAGRMRREGNVPAIMYGLGTESISISVNAHELDRILRSESGANTLITLQLGGAAHTALARQIQRHPVRHSIQHVDFVRVNADSLVEAEVTLHLTGEAIGVKDGGRLEQQLFSITVEAKPSDIPTSIEVDVTNVELGGHAYVRDIPAMRGVTIITEGDETIVTVSVPRGAGGEGEGEAAASAEA